MSHPTSPSPSPSSKSWADMAEEDDAEWTETSKSHEQPQRPSNWKKASCKHELAEPRSCRHGNKCNFAHPGDEHWVDAPAPLTAANVARHIVAPKAVRPVPPKSAWPLPGGAGEPVKDVPDDSVGEILGMALKAKNPEAKDALVRAALALLNGVI